MNLASVLRLFPEFRAESWGRWRSILARVTAVVRELWIIGGRGGGKSRFVGLLAVAFGVRRWKRAPGERIYVGVFGPDRKQSRITFAYIIGLLRSVPELAKMIVAERRESVDLSNGVTIEVITASRAAPRGRAYALAIVEEAAQLPPEDSADPDVELLRAIRPALARVPGSLLAVVSSPYARKGILYTAWEKYHEAAPEDVLFVCEPTLALNPTFDARAIETAFAEDEASAWSEYGRDGVIRFRSDVESFVTREAVEAVTDTSVTERAPEPGRIYYGFADPSGGSGSDSMTLAIAHQADDGTAVLDAIREVRPPFSPERVCEEFAETLKEWGIYSIAGDHYAGTWPAEAFARAGITYEPSAQPKSTLYQRLLPLLCSRRVRLLDLPRLKAQLLGLERRTARGGRDSIDHAPRGHDDVANVAAGALLEAMGADVAPADWISINLGSSPNRLDARPTHERGGEYIGAIPSDAVRRTRRNPFR